MTEKDYKRFEDKLEGISYEFNKLSKMVHRLVDQEDLKNELLKTDLEHTKNLVMSHYTDMCTRLEKTNKRIDKLTGGAWGLATGILLIVLKVLFDLFIGG